ncbi:MAG: ABC transporter substrate-binding protein, partial [Clostridia bacterium]|nr:ABC transporter substrate-binding protein [Clostridia bacterium]
LSGTQASGWFIENAKKAMEDGKILFAGKYSEPDYELLLDNKCPLAIESTMINHSSEVADKLLELGINVLVDRSSFETHPLGRTEWIKLYAALLNEEDAANNFFNKQVSYMEEAMTQKPTGKTASFFNITAAGKAVCRKSGDYVTEMMKIAGGEYVFDSLGDPGSASATVTIEMETFFAGAKDADYMIYNATIAGDINSIDELLAKSSLLSEFKAVQEGNVWCTDRNLYQDTTSAGEMIGAFQKIFSGEADNLDELPSLRRLK